MNAHRLDTAGAHEHEAPGGHEHDAGGAHGQPAPGSHEHRHGRERLLRRLLAGHSHDHAGSLDSALVVSRAGTRALVVSLAVLLATALVQATVVVVSRSVGLLADMTHNFADALTALPLGLAFVVGRRAPTRRHTYGFGRAEDLAGLAVVLVVAASAALAASQAVGGLTHPHRVTHLLAVALAGAAGFLGNQLAAQYRLRVGRRIGSAALVADGYHARADGFTSLAVVAGAIGVAVGLPLADPIVGLLITVMILGVLRNAAREVYRRLMDAVDPDLVNQVEREAGTLPGVQSVESVRLRWIGHELRAELELSVDSSLRVAQAHDVAELVRHELLHRVHRLSDATIHTNPGSPHADAHAFSAHHFAASPG